MNDSNNDVISCGLRHLLGLPNFSVSEQEAMLHALQCFESGRDVGDALDLSSFAHKAHFATSDQGLEKQARKLRAFPPVQLPC